MRSFYVIAIVLYICLAEPLKGQIYPPDIEEFQITSSNDYETTPRLGNDGLTDLVVFTRLAYDPILDSPGSGDIWYQRLMNGSPLGTPVQVTDAATHDVNPDIWGDYIVYTAYEYLGSGTGTTMVYKISTETHYPIGYAEFIGEARIHDRFVVWREGSPYMSKIMMYDLYWLGIFPGFKIAGPDPPTFDIEISDLFVLWTEYSEGKYDVRVRAIDDAITYYLTNTPLVNEANPSANGPWVVWGAEVPGSGSMNIVAMNHKTWETQEITKNRAMNFGPHISGDLIIWDSDLNGNYDVFAHNLSSGETFQVTSHPDNQYLSDVVGDLIAYTDTRNGHNDIYISNISPVSSIVYIPDPHFEQALIDLGIDGDETINHQILRREAEAVKTLDIHSCNIANLTGIEWFINLVNLHCWDNELTSLDFSNNLILRILECDNNHLSSLDVSRNYVLEELECYGNQLSELDVSHNHALYYLNCAANDLYELNVSDNSSLIGLYCWFNHLTSLDVSHNIYLKYLSCGYNGLTSLSVNKNKDLKSLQCYDNSLTTLDVQFNSELIELKCHRNPLGYLNVYNNIKLKELHCYDNQLDRLDVSNNQELIHLQCFSNQLTELDVSRNTKLEWLVCSDNLITSLDLSNNSKLELLQCSKNQLKNLDISNNINLIYLYLNQMPTLYEVCVWEMPFPPVGVKAEIKDSPNVYFTIDCMVNAILYEKQIIPKVFALRQNYPNPFNPSTTINYQLPTISEVEVSIYNLLGKRITTLVSERQQAGQHQVQWDASKFASGIYYYMIKVGAFRQVKKMVLVR